MTVCQHGADGACWRCDGLDSWPYLTARSLLEGTPGYHLPLGVHAVRLQDIQSSALTGDMYLTTRGRVWLVCERGTNWALVASVDPADVTPAQLESARRFIRPDSARASKRDKTIGRIAHGDTAKRQ